MACHLIFTADAKGVQTRAKSPITYLQEKRRLLGSLISTTGIAQRTSRIKAVGPRLSSAAFRLKQARRIHIDDYALTPIVLQQHLAQSLLPVRGEEQIDKQIDQNRLISRIDPSKLYLLMSSGRLLELKWRHSVPMKLRGGINVMTGTLKEP